MEAADHVAVVDLTVAHVHGGPHPGRSRATAGVPPVWRVYQLPPGPPAAGLPPPATPWPLSWIYPHGGGVAAWLRRSGVVALSP